MLDWETKGGLGVLREIWRVIHLYMYVFLSIFNVWTLSGHPSDGRHFYFGSFNKKGEADSPNFKSFAHFYLSMSLRKVGMPTQAPQEVDLPGTLFSELFWEGMIRDCQWSGGGQFCGLRSFPQNLNWQFSVQLCKPHFDTGMPLYENFGQLSSVPTMLGLKYETGIWGHHWEMGLMGTLCVCIAQVTPGGQCLIPVCFEVLCIVAGVEFLFLRGSHIFSVCACVTFWH